MHMRGSHGMSFCAGVCARINAAVMILTSCVYAEREGLSLFGGSNQSSRRYGPKLVQSRPTTRSQAETWTCFLAEMTEGLSYILN